MSAPEDWTGVRVRVRLEPGKPGRVQGVLSEVSDRGIVVRRQLGGGGERPIFFPWRLVRWMSPVEDRKDGS
jgi:hypothetical protein